MVSIIALLAVLSVHDTVSANTLAAAGAQKVANSFGVQYRGKGVRLRLRHTSLCVDSTAEICKLIRGVVHQRERVVWARIVCRAGGKLDKVASVTSAMILGAIGWNSILGPDILTVDGDVVVTIWALMLVSKTKS